MIVKDYGNGRRVTQQQECQERWSRAMALQKALEQWGAPPAGRKPGPWRQRVPSRPRARLAQGRCRCRFLPESAPKPRI